MMRITTWNIRAGGGRRREGIAERLRREAPDLCLLSEYRTRPGEGLKAALGLTSPSLIAETSPPLNQNGLLCYSSSEIAVWHCPAEETPISSHRWLTLTLPAHDIHVLGVHIPNQNERWNKTDFWNHVGSFSERYLTSRALIIGDFNTGVEEDTEGESFAHAEQFRSLCRLGWVDTWRAVHGDRREYTWYSTNGGNGFRLDHCFLSPSLASYLVDATFDHTAREEGLSDHSILTVELSI